ncbi:MULTISPECIES: tRNA glutamyl-Q(34) synthetase GluQRS [Proteus]|uniref:tRNA glutamyl-Q(34) synthetase GluQRS n=1 Tax=Proteus TaxID=583 RepID=UPI000D68BF00|nr:MULTISPECIES: tRNA glutamyl-Q(34) synthetase GluQRS [Proteus]MBG5951120.1 tRNA glutamyl-Q(34) synthetase GluQRS [Proteus terrae]MCE9839081.1 tRNA glutamyl-Q(34) synthetase GluQRS [Proteus terrae]NBN72226.1 tRNA glutamyl-Q(34) synthetase GluQRS [Proteus sp. G2618]
MHEITDYIGRFAPSPTGQLHFGSLVTALGSYLQARAHHGRWLLRIDDIDPLREPPGTASQIIRTLEHYGLFWDEEILYQSQRHDAYRETLHTLWKEGVCYHCHCSRHRLHDLGGVYDNHCRHRESLTDNVIPFDKESAWRLIQQHPVYHFEDVIQGTYYAKSTSIVLEDMIIHRKDNLFAYNLVTVIDDNYQGVTEVVRGADLLDPTLRQISLHKQLNLPIPRYAHLPLAINHDGNKLSKQNHAHALPDTDPRPVIIDALRFLNQPIIEGWQDYSLASLLEIATAQWSPSEILKQNHQQQGYE